MRKIKQVPEELTEMKNTKYNFEDFIKKVFKMQNKSIYGSYVYAKRRWGYRYLLEGDIGTESIYYEDENTLDITDVKYLIYFKEGNQWIADINISMEWVDNSYISYPNTKKAQIKLSYEIGEWKPVKKLIPIYNYILLNSKDEIISEINNISKYLVDYLKDTRIYDIKEKPEIILMAPQLEQLEKAGYRFVDQRFYMKPALVDKFNRLCKPGRNLKEIFKTSKPVYKSMKNIQNLGSWEAIRLLDKKLSLSEEQIDNILDIGTDNDILRHVEKILTSKYNGKYVFTWRTLLNYLDRLDTFEAITKVEAIPIIDDYLMMCDQLGIKPRTNGDSLKREHDIAARLVSNMKDEITARGMVPICEEMKNFDYEENLFFVRGIRSYNDLLDEAKQQHNCVASYGQLIAKRKSLIYVMREKASPKKSLITIELSPDGKEIRQKYLAYNQPIRNKSQSDFLKRWQKFISEKKKKVS